MSQSPLPPPPAAQSQQTSAMAEGISEINRDLLEAATKRRADEMGMGYVDARQVTVNPDVLGQVPREIAMAAELVPFFQKGKLVRVALPKATERTTRVIGRIEQEGLEVETALCTAESLAELLVNYDQRTYHEETIFVAKEEGGVFAELLEKGKTLGQRISPAQSAGLLNEMHEIALGMNLSDLHVEPVEAGVRLRGRVDGVLTDLGGLSTEHARSLLRQLKHESGLKFNITDRPQDGKYRFRTETGGSVDVRISTFPALHGESAVLRFLDSRKGVPALEELGYPKPLQEKLASALSKKSGLVLVTGPTGSGKSTTLFSALSELSNVAKKIVTLEDPIERRLPGVMQGEVNGDMTFSGGLKEILRQDPDVILVGEIRETEGAVVAVEASLTGHLVLSTLHTNAASEAIPRLLDLGVSPQMLSPSLRLVVTQRLLRRVCPHCQQKTAFNANDPRFAPAIDRLASLGYLPEIPSNTVEAVGCEHCHHGYKGQLAVAEMLSVESALHQAIFERSSAARIADIGREEGAITVWECGVWQMLRGLTTAEEVLRKLDA